MKRHGRKNFLVVGEGILVLDEGSPRRVRPTTTAELRKFRFSRIGPKGPALDEDLRIALAEAMVQGDAQPDSSNPIMPAGFTYLGQFVDHDFTLDNTAAALGEVVSVEELIQGRSPSLDLDSLYGRGPGNAEDARFYSDGVRLKMGKTAATPFPDEGANRVLDGFDLPRVGLGSTKAERRKALIPDERNDENLAVAQTHLAFIRFHNRVVAKLEGEGTGSGRLFRAARRLVVRHYQWMLRHDHLPRMIDEAVLDDVFTNGRKLFEYVPDPSHPPVDNSYMCIRPGDYPTMPIEFSVAAYRLGHSMIRDAYEWNRAFQSPGPGPVGALGLLFDFSGTSGTLSPGGDPTDPNAGGEQLPTNWIADFRRLYNFGEAGRSDLQVPPEKFNIAKRVDTLIVDPLKDLPLGAFGGQGTPPAHHRNLAFRNLTRAMMVELATGQQMAALAGVKPLTEEQIIEGDGSGASFAALSSAQKKALVENTPLWIYILREAELNNGFLTGVGGRIVAEVFHRVMEASQTSILRNPSWRPCLGPDESTFRMVDLLLFAFEDKADLLNPLGE